MSYTISININLKNNMNNESTKNLLIESGLNLNLINYYFDYDLEGINNHIKKNNEIIIIEFEELTNIIDYINQIKRFPFIKIKVDNKNAVSFVKSIAKFTDKPLRVDGNEAWESLEEYLFFENEVKDLNIQFIEQPFPSTRVDLYTQLKSISKFDIMGDESIEDNADFEKLSLQFHSINIKLMKASGYYNAIFLLKEAKKYKLKTMIGCMIETSVGISSAIQLSSLADYFDLDGSLLLKNDPYNKFIEKNGQLSLKN